MEDDYSPRTFEVGYKDVVIIFRDDDSTHIFIPPGEEYFSEPDPSWKAMLVALLFRDDDDEIAAIRSRLEDLADEIGMKPQSTLH